MPDLDGTGIDRGALERYIAEQIYSLPGTDRHREEFTVLLTGSRAMGTHTPCSDVDIDVVCSQAVYEAVHRASVEAGIIKSPTSFFLILGGDDYHKYFGDECSRPHFSITPIETVERQFRDHEDVPLWIWTNAQVIADPHGRFSRITEGFWGYPKDVLIGKLKYRWMLAWYWAIEVYPHHSTKDTDLLPAASALLNTVNELLKFFFLAEGRPFPYTEKLMPLSLTTKLGAEFHPKLQRTVDLVIAKAEPHLLPWERLKLAFDLLAGAETPVDDLEQAGYKALLAAGVDPQWVEADYENIDELLYGKLGPVP